MRIPVWFAGMAGIAIVAGAALALRAADTSTSTATPLPASPQALHEIVVRKPAGPPRVQTGEKDHAGRPVTVACSTCHATRPPNAANRGSADLDLFHQGLQVVHGNLPGTADQPAGTNTCLTCHNPGDYDSLRLANGERVAFTEVMRLCAQCHGPQFRDWQHGAHGGMSGYWDLRRGGRMRLGCTSCHDPHVPKYQGAHPVPPPRDRFFTTGHTAGAGHE